MSVRHLVGTVACALALSLSAPARADGAVTFKGSTTSARIGVSYWDVAKPPAAVAGDALVASVTVNAVNAAGIAAAPGWTLECWQANGDTPLVTALYSRIATGAEPVSYRWTVPFESKRSLSGAGRATPRHRHAADARRRRGAR